MTVSPGGLPTQNYLGARSNSWVRRENRTEQNKTEMHSFSSRDCAEVLQNSQVVSLSGPSDSTAMELIPKSRDPGPFANPEIPEFWRPKPRIFGIEIRNKNIVK